MDGSWWYYTLDTRQLVRRRRAIALPMPDEVISRLNELAKGRNKKTKMPKFRYQWNIEEEYESDSDEEDTYDNEIEDQNVINSTVEEMITPVGNNEIDVGVDPDTDAPVEDNDDINESTENDAELVVNNDEIEEISDEVETDVRLEDSESTESEVVPMYRDMKLRTSRSQPGRWSNVALGRVNKVIDKVGEGRFDAIAKEMLFNVLVSKVSKNMTIDEAIEQFGDVAFDSVVKEMLMIVEDKAVVEAVLLDTLDKEVIKRIIPSKMFLREKFNASGIFEKLKARLVAGGHRQSREIYDSGSSPTVSTSSVFICAGIAAQENRRVAVIDFPGAYLNSEVPEGDVPVYMRLDKFLTMVLCKINKGYEKYVNKDGTCVVKLTKALYGTITASKIWYDKLSGKLKELGYMFNRYDMCVFNKRMEDGSQTTVLIHVDDIFLSCSTDEILDRCIKEIENEFGEVTVHKGNVLNYLGMVFDFVNKGKVKITMDGFIEDFFEELGDRCPGICETPAKREIFEVGDSVKLSNADKDFFHSYVAKLLYLEKRVRPDLLVAVSYLTKRVNDPNICDMNKLHRVIKYLRYTKDKGIVIEGVKHLQVEAFVDASHGVHDNFRGHTGATIRIGLGPVYSKSSGQKINTKSSAESELVGLSDSTGQVVWTRNFLIEQGYVLGPAVIYQDNQSTMALIKNGKSNSDRTRHIAIRFFFVSDRVNNNEIKLEYLETGDMLADILTKPLQGELFRKLRDRLLNWYD